MFIFDVPTMKDTRVRDDACHVSNPPGLLVANPMRSHLGLLIVALVPGALAAKASAAKSSDCKVTARWDDGTEVERCAFLGFLAGWCTN